MESPLFPSPQHIKMKNEKILLFIIGGLVVMLAQSIGANNQIFIDRDTENLHDSYVSGRDIEVNTNLNASATLNTLSIVGEDTPQRAYIMFEMNISKDLNVQNASLGLYLTGSDTQRNEKVYYVNETFDESTITWNNQPCDNAYSGNINGSFCNTTPEDTLRPLGINQYYYFNVTAGVQRAIREGRSNVTFLIASDEDEVVTRQNRYSDETAAPNQLPYLNVTYNGTLVTPVVTLNDPKNNNYTHNITIGFNFTIADPEVDEYNYSLYTSTNNVDFTLINNSENTTQADWFYNLTFGSIAGSINGTKFWKVNGTDNSSNSFQSDVFTLTITNDLNLYNVTNVSMTELPLSAGVQALCHFNITGIEDQDGDNISMYDLKWYVNDTHINSTSNHTILSKENTTLGSNITCEVRINNGFGDTAWTEPVNATMANVGDTTPPTITNATISNTAPFSDETVDIDLVVTDASSGIGLVLAEIEGTNYTLSRLSGDKYRNSRTWGVGSYNITRFIARDGNNNEEIVEGNLSYTVTTRPSNGGTPGGGGGGGGVTIFINGTPLIFFGFNQVSFFVISTPSESEKLIVFQNIGNLTFQQGSVEVIGRSGQFISAEMCDIDLKGCKNKSITVQPGQKGILKLRGEFTRELGNFAEGIIRMGEQKENGKIFDLILVIDRPPLYSLVISPISHSTPYEAIFGFNEFPAMVISYLLIVGGLFGFFTVIRLLV